MPITDYVAYWALDEGAGSSAGDASANNNDGTLVNTPAWVAGQLGNALDFDVASSEHVSIPHSASLDIEGAITVAAWVNFETMDFFGTIYGKGVDGGNEGVYLRADSTIIEWGSWDGTDYMTSWEITFGTGEWHHIAGRYTGSAWQLLVDGSQVATTTEATGALASTADVGIGGAEFGGTFERFFNGKIDEVRVYDRSLSDAEILEIYNFTGATGHPTMKRHGGVPFMAVPGRRNVW